jgi:crotonobetainyl-CoA:carnitine CoA-transferase CaiB-like acyl-CoA transferase
MKLTGVKVVDLSSFLPGPYLTMALADHGAQVIKVEMPGEGDAGRHIGLADGEHRVFFRNLNRGKHSVVLDLKTAAGREALLGLCAEADVFVESFRPGVMKRLGIDYDIVRAVNSRIVYCSVSAFGQEGAYTNRPAHDLAVEALSGVLSVTLGDDGAPAVPGIPVADVLSGLHGLAGILMALLRRHETGQGDYLDIAMLDSMTSACANIMGPTFAENRQPVAKHERSTGGSAFYRLYTTSDGRHLAIAGQEAKFVQTLLGAMGRGEQAEPVLHGPGPHQQVVADALQAEFGRRTLAECEAWLSGMDVCYGAVRTLPEAFADAHLVARGMLLRDDAGRPHIGSPIHFLHEPAQINLASPALGAHNATFGAAFAAGPAGKPTKKG